MPLPTRAGTVGANGPVEFEILVENVLNALAAGITIGCIYGLMCIGLGLIFGIMKIVNFAQGELLMLGHVRQPLPGDGVGGLMTFPRPLCRARSSGPCWPGRSSSPAARCCTSSSSPGFRPAHRRHTG